LRAINATAHLGFDALEIPLLHPALEDAAALRMAADRAGVRLLARTALPARCSVIEHAERARVFLGQVLRNAEALGAESVGGALLYTPGVPGPPLTPGDGALLVEVLADLADEAAARGLLLALEPAHRFESRIVNSVVQAQTLVHAVAADNLRLGLSTLQLHIGEASLAAALRQAGGLLYSVRAAENTGGAIGTGAVQWAALWRGLTDINYDGLLILDAPGILHDAALPTFAAQINRLTTEMDVYPEEFAAQGLAFLQAGIAGKEPTAQHAAPVKRKSPTKRSPRKSPPAQPTAAEPSATAKPAPKAPAHTAPRQGGSKTYR
jgi:D-psicose/D-tagatose/L-ribulose 3-epimerase